MKKKLSMPETGNVLVLVVDDQQLIREGITSMLDVHEGISVVDSVENGLQAIEKAKALKPNVILMDIHMPGMDGISAAEIILASMQDIKIIMLTTFDDEEYIIRSLRIGASGYLLKDIPADDLAQAVQLAHAGVYQLDPKVAGVLVGNIKSPQQTKTQDLSTYNLTQREIEVLGLLATGATNREIAEQLFVSEGTVKNHVSNILSRLGLRDRIKAAVFAIEHGLSAENH